MNALLSAVGLAFAYSVVTTAFWWAFSTWNQTLFRFPLLIIFVVAFAAYLTGRSNANRRWGAA